MKSSAEVEAEVEASRSDLDRNVEALKQKMTPGQLFDEGARMLRGTGQQVASRFAEQAKANPMPLAVMGLGLAWLMMSNNRPSSGWRGEGELLAEPRSFAGGQAGGGMGQRLKEGASDLGDRAHEMVAGVQDRISHARASLAESGRSVGEGLGDRLDTVRQEAKQAGQRAQRSFFDTLDSEPLLIAGAGLLIGLAVGAALPSTGPEDRVLGETRDRLLEKGKAMAQSGMQKAGSAAEATYAAVKDELRQGDAEREPADRMADAARAGVQAAQDRLQTPPH